MRTKRTHAPTRATVATACLLAALGAHATEGGGLGAYPDGLESHLAGALPPPGLHGLVYAGGARYDKLRGDDGERIGPPDFKVDVGLVVPRLVWVTQQSLLGGQLAFEALLPLLKVKVRAGGQTFESSGAGDLIVGAALGWHHSQTLHSVLAVDVYAPTARYDAADPSSLGKNHWTVQPIYAVSLINPAGLNVDAKLMWDINRRNTDTRTRSGQALHADLAAGWGLGNGWVVGVGGHVFQQLTSDSGPNAAAGKARAAAIGPSLRYADAQGRLFTAKLQQEFSVRNRPSGAQFFVKAAIPF